VSLFRQEKPPGLNPSAPGRSREGLHRVEFYLDEDDLKLLEALVAASGLRKRARFLRWLLWVWEDLQKLELGDHPEVLPKKEGQMHIGALVDNDPEHPVKLGLAKQRFRGVSIKKLPDGWRKG
jgi:hypothetical protein